MEVKSSYLSHIDSKMTTFSPQLDGDPMSMGLSNFFDDRSCSNMDADMSQSWHTARSNPFYMSNNPFSQTYSLPGMGPNTAQTEQDMIFSSPLTATHPLFPEGSVDLTRQTSTVFTSYSSTLDQSPALTPITQSNFSNNDSHAMHPPPTLLPALTIAPENDRLSRMVEEGPTFNILPISRTPRPVLQKKNTRVDIPPERTLQNIDDMIRNADSDEQVRELKKQKRLLRNRKAALDSRVRKREYTSNLEKDKDGLKERTQALQEQSSRLHHDVTELTQDLEQTRHDRDCLAQELRNMKREQEDMISAHTLETARLRKQIEFLRNHVPQTSGPATNILEPSAFTNMFEPPSLAMTDYDSMLSFNSPLSLMNVPINDNTWPEFQPANDFPAPSPGPVMSKPKMLDDPDAPQSASGLLWLLLLCGAFVATKSAGSSMPSIPHMPEEVRAASATVLDSIFQDAGMPTMTSVGGANPSEMARFVSSVNDALSLKHPQMNFHNSNIDLGMIKHESMDMFGSNYLNPSLTQQGEQLFSITPDQYSSIHSMGNDQNEHGRGRSPRRRSLTEALHTMRANRRDTSTDNINGGFLWNNIPANVIREFRRMVEEDNVNNSPRPHMSSPAIMT